MRSVLPELGAPLLTGSVCSLPGCPAGVVVDSDGAIYVSDGSSGKIWRLPATQGRVDRTTDALGS